MAIATLRKCPVAPSGLFMSGKPDVEQAVKTTMLLFDYLGADGNEEELKSEYDRLAGLGYDGRLYPELPAELTFEQLLKVAEAVRLSGIDPVYRWAPYWTPGTEKRSVTAGELNGSATGFTARLAIHSANPSDCDPVLHFRGLPYDGKYQEKGEATQLEMIERTAKQFATDHAGAALRATDHRDYLVWVLMDRLAGVDPHRSEFILNRGWMRVPVLGRRSVGRGSCVGFVGSHGGGAWFGRGGGFADDDDGVGLSAGF